MAAPNYNSGQINQYGKALDPKIGSSDPFDPNGYGKVFNGNTAFDPNIDPIDYNKMPGANNPYAQGTASYNIYQKTGLNADDYNKKIAGQISAAGGLFGQAPAQGTPSAGDVIKNNQEKQANDFRANLPGFEKGMFHDFQLQEHQRLAQNLSQIKRDAARRGLMNSGIGVGNEARAQAESAGQLAQTRTDINKQSEGMANQLEQDAINTGITQQKMQQEIQDNIYNQALKNLAARRAGMVDLGQGAGGLIGLALAGNTGTTK